MTNEFDYYLIDSKYDGTYQFIELEDFLYEGDINDGIVTLEYIKFRNPIPRDFVMADYLRDIDLGYNYFTARIANAIKKLNIYGVSFIDTELTDPEGNANNDYFKLEAYNCIAAMDKEKSEYVVKHLVYSSEDKFEGVYNIDKFVLNSQLPIILDIRHRVYYIEKLVLDIAILKQIPLEKRLVFFLEESDEKVFFHKSVVDVIMAENPTGVEFRSI